MAFLSPNWRSLNRLKRSLTHPKKVTLNHQLQANCQECSTSAADATLDGGDTKNAFPFIRWKPRRDQDHFVLGTFRFHKGHKLKRPTFLKQRCGFQVAYKPSLMVNKNGPNKIQCVNCCCQIVGIHADCDIKDIKNQIHQPDLLEFSSL